MHKIGIDKIGFYTSHYYLDLAVLAEKRGIDVSKYYVGLGQRKMAIPAPGEDIITMAANAAAQVLDGEDLSCIDTLLFSTETAVDQAKAAGTHLHRLLDLPARCRTVELKQACYGGTAALQMAAAMVQRHPNKKILIIAADVSRYGLEQQGESTQGCGAVAMLVSADPRILVLESEYGVYTEDVFDYWRPNYRREGLIEGRFSTRMYTHALQESWQHYLEESGREFSDHQCFVYHNSVPRLVEKSHRQLVKKQSIEMSDELLSKQLSAGLQYGREIGNAYSASLYVSLISLLDNNTDDLSEQRIGFYAYGSGCVGEFFSGVIEKGYQRYLYTDAHQAMLSSRTALSYEDYVSFYNDQLPDNGEHFTTPEHYNTGDYHLVGVDQHRRIYKKKVCAAQRVSQKDTQTNRQKSTALSPAKLILSGEHAVVYGKPALAIAIDRFVSTTVSETNDKSVSFDLFDLSYHKSMALQTLRDLKNSLKRKYRKFLSGDCGIRDVLKQPFELAQFAAIHFLDHLKPNRTHGLKIETKSDIPVGCGMGSSAAVTLSVLRAITQHYALDVTDNRFLELAFDAERLQHGHPSFIDLQVSLHGGCIYFHKGEVSVRSMPDLPMFLVNTGVPDVSTGECVSQVAGQFAQDPIWDQFESVTNALDQALQKNDLASVQDLVRENHHLLTRIGVVPKKVGRFIEEVELMGAAAKTCGAGAVKGEKAGAVLVFASDLDALTNICDEYAFTVEPIHISQQGLHLA